MSGSQSRIAVRERLRDGADNRGQCPDEIRVLRFWPFAFHEDTPKPARGSWVAALRLDPLTQFRVVAALARRVAPSLADAGRP
jgi:hypothetical protein